MELYLNVIEWGDGFTALKGGASLLQQVCSEPQSQRSSFSQHGSQPRTVFNPRINPRRVARRQRIIMRAALPEDSVKVRSEEFEFRQFHCLTNK